MADVAVAVIYYSTIGTVQAMARRVALAAHKAGADVRLAHVPELADPRVVAADPAWARTAARRQDEPVATADDVVHADAVIVGTPSRYGNVASPVQHFLDGLGPQWQQGLLSDKVYAGFTASRTAHGGQESTLLALYTAFFAFGGIVVPPGYTDPLKFADGNPFGVSHTSGPHGDDPLTGADFDALDHLATRVTMVARWLKRGATL